MSIYSLSFRTLAAFFISISIALFSIPSIANESEPNVEIAQYNDSSLDEANIFPHIQAALNEQEKAIKQLTLKQPSKEKILALETKLESIESSLSSISNKDKYFTYADWAAVAITCVAVLLTIVGLAIAALAFWGYKEIKELTTASAAKEAKEVAKRTMEEMINSVAKSELEKLINDGKLREPLQDAVDMILRSDTDNVDKKRTEALLNELDLFEPELEDSEDDESLGNKKK
ncbi:hypothetical protein RCQ54_004275 [Vibrio alginolyticus]|nr:hypothetical protein [Vibrio alginolyticus]